MPDAAELRSSLISAVDDRAYAREALAMWDRAVVQRVAQVQSTPGISMKEAAEIVGCSRQNLYALLKKEEK